MSADQRFAGLSVLLAWLLLAAGPAAANAMPQPDQTELEQKLNGRWKADIEQTKALWQAEGKVDEDLLAQMATATMVFDQRMNFSKIQTCAIRASSVSRRAGSASTSSLSERMS